MEKWRFLLATDKFSRYFLYFRDLGAPWAIYMGGLSRPVHAQAGRVDHILRALSARHRVSITARLRARTRPPHYS